MTEQWKPVAGYEGLYEVSSHGRVRSLDRTNARGHSIHGQGRSLVPDRDGYLLVGLSRGAKRRIHKVHRLVARAFLAAPGTAPMTVNHRDGNKANNRADNLEWCSHEENMRHATRLGLMSPVKGEANGRALLNDSGVREIFQSAWSGTRQQSIADSFGVSQSAVSNIKYAKSWKHITVPLLAAREKEA